MVSDRPAAFPFCGILNRKAAVYAGNKSSVLFGGCSPEYSSLYNHILGAQQHAAQSTTDTDRDYKKRQMVQVLWGLFPASCRYWHRIRPARPRIHLSERGGHMIIELHYKHVVKTVFDIAFPVAAPEKRRDGTLQGYLRPRAYLLSGAECFAPHCAWTSTRRMRPSRESDKNAGFLCRFAQRRHE